MLALSFSEYVVIAALSQKSKDPSLIKTQNKIVFTMKDQRSVPYLPTHGAGALVISVVTVAGYPPVCLYWSFVSILTI